MTAAALIALSEDVADRQVRYLNQQRAKIMEMRARITHLAAPTCDAAGYSKLLNEITLSVKL